MTLYIDTASKDLIFVSLLDGEKEVEKLSDNNQFGSQVLLGLIKSILEKNNLKYEDLTKIKVNTGPGSYTGLRVGVAVANALAFSLNILVNGKKQETDLVYI